MDKLRAEAREFLQRAGRNNITNFSAGAIIAPASLDELWRDISSHDSGGDQEVSGLC